MLYFEQKNHVMLFIEFHFKQWLYGEEHQYTTSPILFFLKKPKKQNESNNFSKYQCIIECKVTFCDTWRKIANEAKATTKT